MSNAHITPVDIETIETAGMELMRRKDYESCWPLLALALRLRSETGVSREEPRSAEVIPLVAHRELYSVKVPEGA